MIKGITLVTPVASPAALDSLASLFKALGFEAGKGWDDGSGRGPRPRSGSSADAD
jgi:6,7-dimethyl-8-ribityllumazine synthase